MYSLRGAGSEELPKLNPPLPLSTLVQKFAPAYKSESPIACIHTNTKDEDVCKSFINLAIHTQKHVIEEEHPKKQSKKIKAGALAITFLRFFTKQKRACILLKI